MEEIKINDNIFYRTLGFCDENQRNLIFKDVMKAMDEDIEKNLKTNFDSPHQTDNDLFERFKKKKHWKQFYNNLSNRLYNIYKKDLKLKECWANLSKENNNYKFHKHFRDITCVYHLKNNFYEYGTNIENRVIIPAIENSLVIFKGNISHSICNMPKQIAKYKKNYRYSIVFDFDYEKK